MADEQTSRMMIFVLFSFRRTAARSSAMRRTRSDDGRTVANTKREFQPKVGESKRVLVRESPQL